MAPPTGGGWREFPPDGAAIEAGPSAGFLEVEVWWTEHARPAVMLYDPKTNGVVNTFYWNGSVYPRGAILWEPFSYWRPYPGGLDAEHGESRFNGATPFQTWKSAHSVVIRSEVTWFAEQMERKLRVNDWRGGWQDSHVDWLMDRLNQERSELREAIEAGRPHKIIDEAADVANFAMMIADNAKRTKDDAGDPGRVR